MVLDEPLTETAASSSAPAESRLSGCCGRLSTCAISAAVNDERQVGHTSRAGPCGFNKQNMPSWFGKQLAEYIGSGYCSYAPVARPLKIRYRVAHPQRSAAVDEAQAAGVAQRVAARQHRQLRRQRVLADRAHLRLPICTRSSRHSVKAAQKLQDARTAVQPVK